MKKANDEFDVMYKEVVITPKERKAEAASITDSQSFFVHFKDDRLK